ncbi:MAG: helix-turn-helix domain-containing protein [Deltaproteobacteria bacterium]|jgi:cytoskeletal protein RodZ|nr:helix-turn-helix domain-containing protein [Deltaproteobacteria bacterium]
MSRTSIGQVLKQEREQRRLSLEEVSSTTRIPRRALQSLEDDRFEDLPSGVFVRGFIKAYASAVDIDAEDVLAHFDEHNSEALPPTPLASVHSRRGYGVILLAIATAALFAIIVATFALVRRAPAQEDPIELSSAVPCQVEAVKVERSFCVPSITATPTESSRC